MTTDTHKPKILLAGTQMATGGAQKVLLVMADWFCRHGYTVDAVFFYDRENLEQNWKETYVFPITNLNAWQKGGSSLKKGLQLLGGLRRFYRMLKNGGYSAVIPFTHHCNLLALPPAWLAGVPVRMASHHGPILGFPAWQNRVHTLLVNSQAATHLAAVSHQIKRQAVQDGIKEDKITVIHNGINPPQVDPADRARTRAALGVKDDQPLILAVGRVTLQKGFTYLLQAMPQIISSFPNALVVIAGDGPLRPELEQEAKSLGVGEHVRFLGFRQDVPQLLAAADLFAMPSVFEGFPIVLLEAMVMGKAVVASRVQGVDEIVVSGQNGVIVPSQDVPALAQAVVVVLEEPAYAAAMGVAARKTVLDGFTLDSMCRKYEALILDALP